MTLIERLTYILESYGRSGWIAEDDALDEDLRIALPEIIQNLEILCEMRDVFPDLITALEEAKTLISQLSPQCRCHYTDEWLAQFEESND